jgi:hypothetical protein
LDRRQSKQGLGVFSFEQYRLDRANAEAVAITYALPPRVIGPSTFNLVSLWAHYGKTPIRVGALGPTLLALHAYANLLLERPSIVAGDLNNHIRWDKPAKASNHANAVTAMPRSAWSALTTPFIGWNRGRATSHALLARSYRNGADFPRRLYLRAEVGNEPAAARQRPLVCQMGCYRPRRPCAVDRRFPVRIRLKKSAAHYAQPATSLRFLTVKPLQRARSKMQLAFGFLVRRAAQARRVVDGIATKCGQGLFLCDQGRLGCYCGACKGGEPHALRHRVAVHNILRARSAP